MRGDCSKPGTLRVLLFDFNGVLVDDEHLHWRAFREVLEPLGVGLTRALYDARYLSFDDREACRRMLKDALPPGGAAGNRVRRVVAAKRRRHRRLLRDAGGGVPQQLSRTLRRLARRFCLAVVSGAARTEVTAALRAARLEEVFRMVVAAENVRRGKPHPDGYLKALRRLGAVPSEALAIEDSPGGIAAARAAGLRVVGIATSYEPAQLRRAGAFRVLRRADGAALERLVGGVERLRTTRTRNGRRRGWRAPRHRRSARAGSS
jgi:beta-phosphoglucomutase-like phosphatase (HAD superfamily)